jgi:hypothetical protein
MHHASNQSQPLERMGQAIIGHSIRHEIRFGLDFCCLAPHGCLSYNLEEAVTHIYRLG